MSKDKESRVKGARARVAGDELSEMDDGALRRAIMRECEAQLTGKQLAFARFLGVGMRQDEAYERAGYKASRAHASRLGGNLFVRQYALAMRQEASERAASDLALTIEESHLVLARIARAHSDARVRIGAIGMDARLKKDFDSEGEVRPLSLVLSGWDTLTEDEQIEMLNTHGSEAMGQGIVEN